MQVRRWLDRHSGVISLIARELGTSRQKIHQRIKSSPELQAAVTEAGDELLDVAEGHIGRLVRLGGRITVMWYLSRKGRSRGYGTSPPPAPELSERQVEAIMLSLGGSIPKFQQALRFLGVKAPELRDRTR